MDQPNNSGQVRRMLLPAFALAAIGMVVTMVWFVSRHRESHADAMQSVAAVPDMTATPEKIRQQAIAEIRRPAPFNASTEKAATVAMDANEILEQGNQATLRRLDELDARYRGIPANPRWAGASKTEIDALVNTDIPQVAGIVPAAYESSCRDRVCRVQADFRTGSGEDWGDILTAGLAQALPKTRMLVLRNADGSTRIVMYAMERSAGL